MGIKFQCRLKLPYIIRLKEQKDYEREFNFPEFPLFKLTLLFNDSSFDEIHMENQLQESCQFIQIEVITNKYDYKKYSVSQITVNTSKEDYIVNGVPEEVEMEIMKDVSHRVNQILKFIREKSHMFWVDDIPLNPTSDMLGVFTNYSFYAPTAQISENFTSSITTLDNYMESDSGVNGSSVDDIFFDDFDTFEKTKYSTSFQFLDRAKSTLYELRIYEAIILASIAEESFITKYIEDNTPQNDIIFKKLNSITGQLMDLKYNIILKHLKKQSLQEIKEDYWQAVKGIYILRNAIMHNGEITLADIKKAKFPNIEFATIKQKLILIENAFLEIEKL